MSQVTREINKVTSTIIGISGKLIIYAVVILLLVEGMTRGYAFGHSIFYSTPMEEAPGTEKTVTIAKNQDAADAVRMLKDMGLISNDLAVLIQMKFYDYDIYPGTYTLSTAMTSKEILQVLNEKPEENEEEGQTARTDAEDKTDGGNESGSGAGEAAETDGEPEVEIQINGIGSDRRPI